MKVCLAGEGAIGRKHLAALDRIEGVEVAALAGGDAADTAELAERHGIPFWSLNLGECIERDGVDAVILATPTGLHASQAIQVLRSGRHCLIEIPMADNLADAEEVLRVQEQTGLTAMVCHTRRFNPGHQWIRGRIECGELHLQHLVAETFFFRRGNRNALGKPRTWTDHLLWHHACHTVDLFQHQTGEVPDAALALQGPPHPALGIAMDMTVGLRSPSGSLCSLALSFNNDGPFGTTYRYICDAGTYIARYDDLVDGEGNAIDVSDVAPTSDGIELQDREFLSAVAEGREPECSVQSAVASMGTLDRLARALAARGHERS